jgi:hypothetical protein
MAQVVEYLPSKHKTLSPNRSTEREREREGERENKLSDQIQNIFVR